MFPINKVRNSTLQRIAPTVKNVATTVTKIVLDQELLDAAKGTSLEKYAKMIETGKTCMDDEIQCSALADDKKKDIRDEQLSYTMSSALISETIASPNIEQILRGLAMLLDSMIEKDAIPQNDVHSLYYDFSSNGNEEKPSAAKIFRLLFRIHSMTDWSSETIIIGLLLVIRLLGCGNIYLHVHNWKRIVICALLLAQKVWDDKPLPTGELEILWRHCVPEEAPVTLVEWKAMEIKFLQMIGYDVSFSRRSYTKWYFELRALVTDPGAHYELSEPESTINVTPYQEGVTCSNIHIVFESRSRRGKQLNFDILGTDSCKRLNHAMNGYLLVN